MIQILNEIEQIYADQTLTQQEKDDLAATKKADAWRQAILGDGVFPQSWGFTNGGDEWVVTLTKITMGIASISLEGSCTKNGEPVLIYRDGTTIWPINIVNPPLLFQGEDGTFYYDLVQLIRDILSRAVVQD